MICFFILLVSGWTIELMGNVNRWVIMVCASAWFILMPFTWQVSANLSINLSIVLIIALIIFAVSALSNRSQITIFILLCLFISCWHGFMVYVHRSTSTYLIHSELDAAIGEALLIGAYMKNPLIQIGALSWGVMAGIVFEQLWSDPIHIAIGQAVAWDQLLIAVLLTRVVSLIVQWSHNKLYSK